MLLLLSSRNLHHGVIKQLNSELHRNETFSIFKIKYATDSIRFHQLYHLHRVGTLTFN